MSKLKLHWFVIGMMVFALFSLCFVMYAYFVSLQLVPTEGQLLYVRTAYTNPEPRGPGYRAPGWRLNISYQYRYEGVIYEGSRLYVGGNGMGLEVLAEIKAESLKPLPRPVTVWVDPQDPRYSVLERGVGLSTWIFVIMLMVVTYGLHRYLSRHKN